MQIKTQRFVDAFFGSIILRVLDVLNIFRPRPKLQHQPESICILLLSEMGSLSLTWPMLKTIEKKYPVADICLVTLQRNREIMELMGLVDKDNIITVNDASLVTLARDSAAMLMTLRERGIDTVIDCELFSRISSIYSSLSGASVRAGFHRHTQEGLFRGNHINRPVLYNPYLHISQQFVNLVLSLDGEETPGNKYIIHRHIPEIPGYKVSKHDKALFKGRIERFYPKIFTKPLVLLNPGGGLLPIRAWPVDYFRTVARKIVKSGFSVAVTGLSSDTALAKKIISGCPENACFDLTGVTRSIKELLLLFSVSKLLITNDGGPGHFAGLTSTPAIILFGPETPVLYGSINPHAVNLHSDCACSPCLTAYNHRNSPCNGHNLCLKAIKPEEVLETALHILKSRG